MVAEAALDAVAEAYEHFDVQRVIGVSIAIVLDTEKGVEMTSHVAWDPK